MYDIFMGNTPDDLLYWGILFIFKGDKFSDGTGNPGRGEDYKMALYVDHLNPWALRQLSEWMNWLKQDIGFNGWRFNFVMCYSPEIIHKYMDNKCPNFTIGELWKTVMMDQVYAHHCELVAWTEKVSEAITAFNFTNEGHLPSGRTWGDVANKGCQWKPARIDRFCIGKMM